MSISSSNRTRPHRPRRIDDPQFPIHRLARSWLLLLSADFFTTSRVNRYQVMSFVIAQFNPLQYVQVNKHEEIPALLKSGKLPAHTHINVVTASHPKSPNSRCRPRRIMRGYCRRRRSKSWGELR